jgi:hypothetical protein
MEPPSLGRDIIPVGDSWRATLRPPVFGTLALALGFLFYTAPVKETPALFDHAPWLNDPFDTVISFMMFFVPLIALLCVPRVLMCRRSEPLPVSRICNVLRGCRVVLVGVSLTLLSEWVSVAIGDNSGQWNGATWFQIGLLAAMSALTAWAVLAISRVGLPQPSTRRVLSASPDWTADVVAFLRTRIHWFGPGRRTVLRLLDFTDHSLLKLVRRHPLWMALACCGAFGAGVGVNQGIREGYTGSVTLVVALLLATGMFGLLVAAGSYLGLVHSSIPTRGAARRCVDAMVITSVGLLVPFAFRYHLWSAVGSTNSVAGLGQLLGLLGMSSVILFALAYGAESLLRLHND